MSRTAICIDNSPINRFLEYFKTESDNLKKYKTFEELVADIYFSFSKAQHGPFSSWNEEQSPCA